MYLLANARRLCFPEILSVLNFSSSLAERVSIAGPVHPLPFEDVDAELAGAIRADLESVGKPIGAYDLLIAGQAMRNKLTLITANLLEFARIKALAWADWGKP